MNRKLLLVVQAGTLVALVTLSSCVSKVKPEGISVGNGRTATAIKNVTYVSPYQYRLSYSNDLDLHFDELETNVTISNKKFVSAAAETSKVHIEVVRRGTDYPGFAAKTAATGRHLDGLRTLLQRKYPGVATKRIDLTGAHGFTFPVETKGGVGAKSFLLNGNLDLLIVTLEARASGNGLEKIVPIINTFTGDPEPPYVTNIRLEAGAMTAPGQSRIVFKALDPSGISLDVPKGGIVLAPIAARDSEGADPVEEKFVSLGNDEFAVGFKVGPFAAKGNHSLKKLTVMDKAGNRQVVLPAPDASALPLASVQVDNPNEDVTGPTFGKVLLKTNPEDVIKPGDQLTLELELTDEGSGVAIGEGAACVVLARYRNTNRVCGKLEVAEKIDSKDLKKGPHLYRLTLKTGLTWISGPYALAEVIAFDTAGNSTVYTSRRTGGRARMTQESVSLSAPSPMSPAAAAAPASAPGAQKSLEGAAMPQAQMRTMAPASVGPSNQFSFTNEQGDESEPLITSAKFGASETAPGSSPVLSVEAHDIGTGVALGQVEVVLAAEEASDELPDVTVVSKVEASSASKDTFTIAVPLSPWHLPGRYVVKSISLKDGAGNLARWDGTVPKPLLIVK